MIICRHDPSHRRWLSLLLTAPGVAAWRRKRRTRRRPPRLSRAGAAPRPGRCPAAGSSPTPTARRPARSRSATTAAKVGKRVEFDPKCATLFPFIPEIVGWRLNDNDFLRLLDAQGKFRARVQRGRERHLRGAEAGRGHPVHPESHRSRPGAEDRRADDRRLEHHPPHRPAALRADACRTPRPARSSSSACSRPATRSVTRVRAGDLADGSRRDRAARRRTASPGASRRRRIRSGSEFRRPPIRC